MKNKDDIKKIVGCLIEEYMQKYPPARLQAIKERMKNFWDGMPFPKRIPYVIWQIQPPKDMPQLPEDMPEDDKLLITQLKTILEHAHWDDDFFPALFPGVRQVTLPSYFGCTEETASASVKVKPAINSPTDVYSLPRVGFGPETAGGQMLARMRYWREITGGTMTFYEADLQGPFSVASQIWGVQEFLTALYDYPEEVHHLLGRCTDALIEFVKLMYEAVDGDMIPFHCMPAIWFPKEKGVALSEDLVAVVSPGIIREFVKPYLEKIASTFGGVFLHSCGSINNVVGELCNIEGLVGLNFSNCETDLVKAIEDIKRRVFIVSHNSPINRIDLPLLTPLQHAEKCARVFSEKKVPGICIIIPFDEKLDINEQLPAIEKAVRIG